MSRDPKPVLRTDAPPADQASAPRPRGRRRRKRVPMDVGTDRSETREPTGRRQRAPRAPHDSHSTDTELVILPLLRRLASALLRLAQRCRPHVARAARRTGVFVATHARHLARWLVACTRRAIARSWRTLSRHRQLVGFIAARLAWCASLAVLTKVGHALLDGFGDGFWYENAFALAAVGFLLTASSVIFAGHQTRIRVASLVLGTAHAFVLALLWSASDPPM